MLLTLRNHLENALHWSRNNLQTNLIRIPFLLSQCNNLLLMAVTKRNSNIALILFFLYRLTNVSGNVLSSFSLFSSRCAKITEFSELFCWYPSWDWPLSEDATEVCVHLGWDCGTKVSSVVKMYYPNTSTTPLGYDLYSVIVTHRIVVHALTRIRPHHT